MSQTQVPLWRLTQHIRDGSAPQAGGSPSPLLSGPFAFHRGAHIVFQADMQTQRGMHFRVDARMTAGAEWTPESLPWDGV